MPLSPWEKMLKQPRSNVYHQNPGMLSLCPLRSLKVYLTKTKPFREGKRLLFIYFQKNKTSDVSKTTISGWIRALLHLVYSNANKDTAGLSGSFTHAIRSMVPSLAFMDNVLLKNCSWKIHTTFRNFIAKMGPRFGVTFSSWVQL